MAQGAGSNHRRIYRFTRWLGLAAALPALWGCLDRTLVAPDNHPSTTEIHVFPATLENKLDVLFMIDNSPSMAPLQQKLLAQFPVFMDRLKMIPAPDGNGTALPNIHVAVVSSDTGPGKFDATPGCHFAGDRGEFQFRSTGTCTTSPLKTTPNQQTFLAAAKNQDVRNYVGDISDAFKCIAALGDKGCGFEGQLKSVRWALDPSNVPPGNEGFLRPDAFLAVILITNEDDCSVPDTSDMIDSQQTRMSDPLGPYWSFRCNEFGHLCMINGRLQPPPRGAADNLQGCISNDTDTGRLTKVRDEVAFLKSLKTDPGKIFVAAISGVPDTYGIEMVQGTGDVEQHPNMKHTCTNGSEYADPAVRIKEWVDSFGDHGLMQTICANDFRESLQTIANAVGVLIKPECIKGTLVDRDPTTPALEPECQVSDTFIDAQNRTHEAAVHACAQNATPPCWSLDDSAMCTTGGRLLNVTRGPDGAPEGLTTTISCATCIPGVARAGCACVAGKEVDGCLR